MYSRFVSGDQCLKHVLKRVSLDDTGEKDADGVYTNTEDIDCDVCKGDLHLWAVVSPTCPERATCPEHVSALECSTETMRLLYRCVQSLKQVQIIT